MKCGELFSGISSHILEKSSGFRPETQNTGICQDSRKVIPGSVFTAVRGTKADGHDMISEAVSRGASLVVLDRADICDSLSVPWILVNDTAAVLLPLYLTYHGHPEHGMRFTAVTGTNGKTSVTCFLEAILSRRARCAVIGTIGNRIGGVPCRTDMTTPAPEALSAFLAKAARAGVTEVILEASSHALAQRRLSGLPISTGIFTNLTEDHLDYHKTTDAYFAAKRSLFYACSLGAVNTDDPFGQRLFSDPAFAGKLHGYSAAGCAEFSACGARDTACGSAFCFRTERDRVPVTLSVPGDFMISNALAALTSAVLSGIPAKEAAAALAAVRCIPGRMETIVSEPFAVYLDYAHTPDALMHALSSLRKRTSRRLLVLFGCGGDREKEKRPAMGRIAAELADLVFVTDDNPRTEDPAVIRQEILAGIPDPGNICEIEGRESAIRAVLDAAQPGDTVLLAGKGHEDYTIDRGGRHPFSEREIVYDVLGKKDFSK